MVITRVIKAVAIDDVTPPCRTVSVIGLFTDAAIRLPVLPGVCVGGNVEEFGK